MTNRKFRIGTVASAAVGAILLSTLCVGGAIAPVQATRIAAVQHG